MKIIKTIKSLMKKHPKLFVFSLIAVVTFLAYGQTIFDYYGQDDHSLIFKLQHVQEGMGMYGQGITGRVSSSPYRYIVVPFWVLYPLFGHNPFGYFAVGVLNYFFAGIAVYFLAWHLTKNKKIAIVSSLIFASGFVGADTMIRLTNSYQIPHAIIFICITLILYKRYVDTKNIIFYFASTVLFALTMECFFVRAHGIIFLIAGLEIIYNFNLKKSLPRLLPFAVLYYGVYIKGSPTNHEVTSFFQNIFLDHKTSLILAPLRSFQNLFIPERLIPENFIYAPLIFLAILFFVLVKKRNKTMWFAVLYAGANILAYVIHDPTRALFTTHRYVTISFVGVAIFYSILLLESFKNKNVSNFLCGGFILLNLAQTMKYIHTDLVKRNIPTRNFYNSLTTQIPTLPKNSALFFDVAADGESRRQFGNAFGVGSMPDMTAIAHHYNIDRYDVYLPENFPELLSLVRNGSVPKENVYTLYFDASRGLTNTTSKTRADLWGKNEEKLVDVNNLKYEFNTPQEAKLTLTTDLQNTTPQPKEEIKDIDLYLSYLLSREEYYKTANVQVSSEWKYQEGRNILDDNTQTTWMSNRFVWPEKRHEDIIIDLGGVENVGAVKMSYASDSRVPLEYEYWCSANNLSWQLLGKYSLTKTASSGTINDIVKNQACRYVKISILKTKIDDSPQLSEVEIVKDSYSNLDFDKAALIEKDLMSFASRDNWNFIKSFIEKSGIPSRVCYNTDKYASSQCQNIKLFPGARTYNFTVPQGGTILTKVAIQAPTGISTNIQKLSLRPLSYDKLFKNGYILDFGIK